MKRIRKGTYIWCPKEVLKELEEIKNMEEIDKRSFALRKMAKNSKRLRDMI